MARDQIAFHIRDIEGFRGHASLYKLDPPFVSVDGLDADQIEMHEYVIASAVDLPGIMGSFHSCETYVFPANSDGQITDYIEIAGVKDVKDHQMALDEIEYRIEKAIGRNTYGAIEDHSS